MALTDLQELYFDSTIDVFRKTITDDTCDEYNGTAVLTSVPCYFENTANFFERYDSIKNQKVTVFTTDIIHVNADVDIRAGDCVVQRTGANVGDCWILQGNVRKLLGPEDLFHHGEVYAAISDDLPANVS